LHLPKVTKVLCIGWRGAEEHFLDLLKSMGRVPVMTVAGTPAEAAETLKNISPFIKVSKTWERAGFRDTLRVRGLDELLST
jgi:hypothetical protein